MAAKKKPKSPKSVKTLTHAEEKRKNIPTAEYQSMVEKGNADPLMIAYERRNPDLDPQLVWRGKDVRDWSDLVVPAPPLYIQEKVHPKVLIDDLKKLTTSHKTQATSHPEQIELDLFGDFNGVPEGAEKTEFYAHDQNWSNRMILGDSMQVMASLAEREGLRGKVQCIYLDPPYGIKFNSNFQWSTTSRDVKDGKAEHITREPEQVKAFRDTWRDGIHSYLTYLRDRLTVARELLTDSGSIFVQIGDENVHRVRALMDEVFGEENFRSLVTMKTTGGLGSSGLKAVSDYILWFARNHEKMKFRKPLLEKVQGEGSSTGERYSEVYEINNGAFRTLTKAERKDASIIPSDVKTFQYDNLISSGYTSTCTFEFPFEGRNFSSGGGRSWKTNLIGMNRLAKGGRIGCTGKSIRYRRFIEDYLGYEVTNIWTDIAVRTDKQYVVETSTNAIQRCILMATDPGDLVLDPTCGSGTTAYVAEQWGRRWITIDTSRVALALARARIMGARYPFYLLADSKEGQQKEAEVTRSAPSSQPVNGDIRHGFVYERVPHITLKSIANNTEIDVIWDRFQEKLEPLRQKINEALGTEWEEWEIPRELPRMDANKRESKQEKTSIPNDISVHSRELAVDLLEQWWELRIARQKEIDASIAAKADFEYLYDKPYEDKKTVRVAGPFTVESLSPHRVLGLDENDDLIDTVAESGKEYGKDYVTTILDTLRSAGVQQAHKQDKIDFFSLQEWPGQYICAEGRYTEGNKENGKTKRAGIFVGPEFGTVTRVDLVAAAREAADADFDLLITCAFSYEAHTTDFNALGGLPVLKATMNADLHMAGELKNTGKGNLFVIFGEPDIEIREVDGPPSQGSGGTCLLQVEVKGVDVFHPNSGEVRSDGPEGIACWFLDTDYNEESFFVRHAYFLGQNDPYKSLKTTLKAEIDPDAWDTLNSPISRPFPKPQNGRLAVKIINHLGDEVMKVFKV